MYLKALEIQGFKSFPQKTRLTFEKEITAIVGPNGSGKSNISDAVRWVMGEQSTKALRGGKMEDVIFGGTERRGQTGFAEVSLILDNSGGTFDIDASEVMITRRYYRSGDSEYYINKKSCRLRDINELLMDTGLGREGYSIIGQGRIDEILSVKSTDRREIFEEAAGISRFRHRKEESEKKLQQAEENLVRINDKISELEMQVEPLKKQSETAKKYLTLRDELRGLEISVWTEELKELGEKAEKYEADFKELSLEQSGAKNDIEKYYRLSEAVSESIRGKDIESEKVRVQIESTLNEKNETENKKAVLEATRKANEENMARIRDELNSHEDRSRSVLSQIDRHKSRLDEIAGIRKENEKNMAALSCEADILAEKARGTQEELGRYIREENELASYSAGIKARIETLKASAQETSSQAEDMAAELESAEKSLAQEKKNLENAEQELRESRERLTSVENMIQGCEMRLASRRKKVRELEERYSAALMNKKDSDRKISLLSDMERDYAGYSRAVKLVMQEAGRGVIKGIRGTVGGLLTTETRYALAIETALGGSMQSIIVDSEEDGKSAINFLKKRDGGRATFLPLTVIKGSSLAEDLSEEPGFEGVAADLISYDRRYAGIYLNLLGRTAVCGSLDSAVRIGRKYKNKFRIVTLDGQLVNAGGSMTGGSASKNSGVISRANELAKLKKAAPKLKEEISAAEGALASARRDFDSAGKETEIVQAEKRSLEDSILKLEGQVRLYTASSDSLNSAVSSVRARLGAVMDRQKDGDKELERLNAAAREADEKSGVAREKSMLLSQGYKDIEDGLGAIREKRDALLRENASLSAEAETLSASIAQLKALAEDMSGGAGRQRQMMDDLAGENEMLEREAENCAGRAAELDEKTAALRERLSQLAAEKMELEAQRTKRDRIIQEMNDRMLNLERESGRLEQLKISAQLSAKQIIDKLWDTYELSRSAARELARELENRSEAQKRIGQLKSEISKLGNPNIGAIDEYERVSARYNYLTEQRDDAETSKNELYEIIDGITGEMTDIFSEKFKEIDESFRHTFVELFGGGKAALELEDKDDILNCGIEIRVQPPGKSLKTLTLLSGGEKAFVAIALYFAILKIRPTPFVIMDEIESALDEVNNARFAEYMRRLTDKTQFLVITHRRRTMEEADVLYGVTMQEKGVSTVINIDLDQAEKTILN